MSKIQKSIEMTVQLYKARDAARLLLGHKYHVKMAEYIDLIKMVMKDKSISAIAAMTEICKVADDPMQQIQIISAFVEMVEPSEAKVK